MASFNNITLLGNVGRDPETKTFEGNDSKVATFTMATSTGRGDKETTMWHNIVAWSPLAEVIEKYVKKGSTILVNGELRYRSYTGRDGMQRQITEILAKTIQFCGGRSQETTQADTNDIPF